MIPPKANAEFVCAMEDVLEVYKRPQDPQRPVVCLDETSKQLVGETRTPVPAAPGQPRRVDYEYQRNGTANLFMTFEPLAGKRWVKVTQRRTATDFAEVIRELVDERYQQAAKIILVMDNLNTHKLASLYEAFEPAEARRLLERLEIHYTPKHGTPVPQPPHRRHPNPDPRSAGLGATKKQGQVPHRLAIHDEQRAD